MRRENFDARKTVAAALPKLERDLRLPVIATVTSRARSLAAEELEDEATLAVALARVAASAAAIRSAQSKDEAATGESAKRREALSAERQRFSSADRRDQALVALEASRGLVIAIGDDPDAFSERLDTDTLLETALALASAGHDRLVRERALSLATATLETLPLHERQLSVGVQALREVTQYAQGQGATGFVQSQALSFLTVALGAEVLPVLREQLHTIDGRDSMLQRHHAVRLIPRLRVKPELKLELAWHLRADPSEHVRQGLAKTLRELALPHAYELLGELVRKDASPRVCGVALLELLAAALEDPAAGRPLQQSLVYACGADELLQRTALFVGERLLQDGPVGIDAHLASALSDMIQRSSVELAEQAALLVRAWELQQDRELSALEREVASAQSSLAEGKSVELPDSERWQRRRLERVVCVRGANDFPLGLRYRRRRPVRLQRGERRRSRAWRLLHELLHPAPDKRQNYLHPYARADASDAVSVPLRLAEVTPTRVPGERRTALGQSWGGFLPRVDDALFACEAGRARRLLTVFGTLALLPPVSWFARLKARLLISLRYASLCELRERSLRAAEGDPRRAYVARLRRLGLECRWEEDTVELAQTEIQLRPKRVDTYYALAPLPITLWLEDVIQYVLLPTGNTAWHLAVVVWLLLSAMVIRSAWTLSRFESSRRAIPLSLGGWGSRGKSGTERLKAALFHSQHYDVVSKTTGCEAMIIVARRGEPASEVFLYRPYDKATIWEQERVVEYAQALGAQVFLWECMALQPEFVDILNREWMKDSITTITNAYPDHEDVMGPSGEDVARVIGQFVPQAGVVISSEEQMRPVIAESATKKGAKMLDVGALEADLLPRDLLQRFPYEEHPRNIALVLRLAEVLGLERERALVDMADYVFPDLGVLKTYPLASHKGRALRFSNGMSANERAGFLSNWRRLGFSEHRADERPERLIVAVVNNRADRVPRSRVFAELLARDATLDSIVVIGTNTKGMRRFLSEAIEQRSRDIELAAGEAGAQTVHGLWDELGAPRTSQAVAQRVELLRAALLPAVAPEAPPEARSPEPEVPKHAPATRAAESSEPAAESSELVQELEALVREQSEPRALRSRVQRWAQERATQMKSDDSSWCYTKSPQGQSQELAAHLVALVLPWCERTVLSRWVATTSAKPSVVVATVREFFVARFESKLAVLHDSDATGDQVIDFVARQLPPGLTLELLGCQNIKGTGLDFVYRFTSLGRVDHWLRLLDEQPEDRGATLHQLLSHADYGLLDSKLALDAVSAALEVPTADWEPHRATLERLKERLSELYQSKFQSLSVKRRRSALSVVLGWVEPFIDHLDAISRHKRAVRTMHELINGRIPQAVAVERLRELTARQKGGWLAKDLAALLARRGG